MTDSPTPINSRERPICIKFFAIPDSAVSTLQRIRPAAISRGRCTRSASAPINKPIIE